MLELIDVRTYYGRCQILDSVSLEVKQGSVVALLGRNGMGKTTTAHSIMGITPPREGKIYFQGENIAGLKPYQISRKGLGLVPQGRRIFPTLSVEENLTIAARKTSNTDAWTLPKIYSLFPILERRAKARGTSLSGGEQQMLCLARALLTNPSFLVMDEPSEGLAPLIVQSIADLIALLKSRVLSGLLIEQNLRMALDVADYIYILDKRKIVYHSEPVELKNNPQIQERHLAVTR
jgi:branched-chain amino acid transport system ATP-binding protein